MINTAQRTASRRPNREVFPACGCLFAAALMMVCALTPSVLAAPGDPFRYRGGMRNSPGERKLNAKQLDALVNSLRDKAGFLEMHVDEDGFLALGDRMKFNGGSATARALLAAAVDVPHAIDLECHNHSSLVAFARLATPVIYHQYSSGKRMDVYPLQIDFSDLWHLRGDREVVAAFDLGFVILHELGHAALGLQDLPRDGSALGECEELINRIRRELNLPERQTYIAQVFSVPSSGLARGTIKQAELIFERTTDKQGRAKLEKLNLRWEALKVGPIVDAPIQSMSRIRNPKTVTSTLTGQ